MKIEIDQSGRIEYTRKPTVLAYSNSHTGSLIILAAEKQYLQQVFRKAGETKIMMIKTFAILVFLLINDTAKAHDEIVIDREYDGYDRLIKSFLSELYAEFGFGNKVPVIHFGNIGKKSRAHGVSYDAYQLKKADRKVIARDILKILFHQTKKSGIT